VAGAATASASINGPLSRRISRSNVTRTLSGDSESDWPEDSPSLGPTHRSSLDSPLLPSLGLPVS
jgi:hypothetical protein